jgi:hypothetical protein
MFKFFTNKFKKIIQCLKNNFKEELKKLEENQNKDFNNKIDNFNKKIEEIYENKVLKELNDSKRELKNLREKAKKRYEIIKDIKIPEIDKNKFIVFYSDDHPGALFQMYNDLRVIIEKRTHIVEISEELEKNIKNQNICNQCFQLIPFKKEYAPYEMEYFIEKGIVPDIAVLDIIFGGLILEDNQFIIKDGIDIGELILKKNPKAVIIFYTGCELPEYSNEAIKLKKLLNEFPENVFVVDKDINDQHRIETFYKAFKKELELNSEKFQKLLKSLQRLENG